LRRAGLGVPGLVARLLRVSGLLVAGLLLARLLRAGLLLAVARRLAVSRLARLLLPIAWLLRSSHDTIPLAELLVEATNNAIDLRDEPGTSQSSLSGNLPVFRTARTIGADAHSHFDD
jgi:hypothetical protein